MSRSVVYLGWCVAFSLIAAAAVPAQQLFDELGRRMAPDPGEADRALTLLDVDGDGDLDVVLAGFGRRRLFHNDGHGTFSDAGPAALPAGTGQTFTVTAADVDGDGDLDLLWGKDGADELSLNVGNGTFVPAPLGSMPAAAGLTRRIVASDLDGDGDLDLLLGQENGLLRFDNDGNGVFSDVTGSLPGGGAGTRVRGVAAGDVDGDGDNDIVYGGTGFARLLRNTGGGAMIDATSGNLPAIQGLQLVDALSLADLDGFGALDLVVGLDTQAVFPSMRTDQVWRNQGSGQFGSIGSGMPADTHGVDDQALFDFDGDGDLDLVTVADLRPARVLEQVAAWTFADTGLLAGAVINARAAAIGDVDGDGDPDVVMLETSQYGAESSLAILLSEGGSLIDASAPRVPRRFGHSTRVAVADLDGDGDLDVVAAEYFVPSGLHVFRNRGDATFGDEFLPASPAPIALALVDLDQDLDVDMLTVEAGELVARLNDGTGTFSDQTAAVLPGVSGAAGFIVTGDTDGDGDQDVIVVGGPTRQLRNLGGVLIDVTATTMPNDLAGTGGAVLEDLDGDGDLDLFAGTFGGGPARLFVNDGSGVFTDVSAAQLPGTTHECGAVCAGDVDGDGDVDLFVGDSLGQDRLWRNDGTGAFTDVSAAQLPIDADALSDAAFVDADEDGDLDLIGARTGPTLRLYRNDGAGTFTDVSSAAMFGGGDLPMAIVAADFDGDGDQDLFEGSVHYPGNRVLLNLTRQTASPRLLRSGRPWSLDCYAQPAPGSLFEVVVPYLSTTRLPTPIAVPPLGLLQIDPILPLPAVLVAGGGPAPSTWNVPSLPAFVGIELYGQALFVSWNVSLRLGNLVVETLR